MKSYHWLLLGIGLGLEFFLGACGKEEVHLDLVTDLQGASEVSDAQGNLYRVGYDQVNSINQDPYVEKLNAEGQPIWAKRYENTGVDGRGVLVALDADQNPWVVFTVDGGSNEAGYITQKETEEGAFSNVFLPGYGKGGGAKVCVLARLHPETGKIVKGTFLMSRTKEGNYGAVDKTNTMLLDKLGFANGHVVVEGNAWFLPPSAEATASNFRHHPEATAENKSGNSWRIQIELPTDLSKLAKSTIIRP
ncbi:MAG: hypothetical protein OHK0053_01400 [Microscillaceae bacterium]